MLFDWLFMPTNPPQNYSILLYIASLFCLVILPGFQRFNIYLYIPYPSHQSLLISPQASSNGHKAVPKSFKSPLHSVVLAEGTHC